MEEVIWGLEDGEPVVWGCGKYHVYMAMGIYGKIVGRLHG